MQLLIKNAPQAVLDEFWPGCLGVEVLNLNLHENILRPQLEIADFLFQVLRRRHDVLEAPGVLINSSGADLPEAREWVVE